MEEEINHGRRNQPAAQNLTHNYNVYTKDADTIEGKKVKKLKEILNIIFSYFALI